MASTFRAVSDTMQDMNFSTYVVKSRSNSMIGYQLDKKLNVDMAIDRLKKLLLETTGDFVKLEINPRSSGAGDAFKCIKMDVDLSTVPGKIIAGMTVEGSGMSAGHLRAMEKKDAEMMALKEELIQLKFQQKIDKLEEQIAGVKDNDPIGKLTEIIIPVLIQYLPGLLTPKDKKAINGFDTIGGTDGLSTEARAVLMTKEILNIDQNADELMAAIYLIASKNIEAYNAQKPMLINYAKTLDNGKG